MAQGSIIKRGNKYCIVFRDQDGKQHWKTVGKTKREAERALTQVMGSVNREEFTDKKIDFSTLTDAWLSSVRPNLEPSSFEFYQNISRHLKLYFKATPIRAIDTAEIEAYMASQMGLLSNTTIGYHLGVLKMILNKAQIWRYVYSNATLGLKRPKPRPPEIQLLAAEQLRQVLETFQIKKPEFYPLVLTATLAGMRAAELCGLSPDDVDLVNGEIDIHRTYVRGQFKVPKTKGSKRRVIIPPLLVEELARAKDRAVGDLLFSRANGAPIDWSNWLHGTWEPMLKAAGVPHTKFHNLRHNYVSLLIDAGEQIPFISQQVGHANVEITMKVYAHLLPNQDIGAGDRIQHAFDNYVIKMLSKDGFEAPVETSQKV